MVVQSKVFQALFVPNSTSLVNKPEENKSHLAHPVLVIVYGDAPYS
jgi:hypothetical protein